MPVQDPSFLTKAEKTYLEEHLYSYRQTPHGDKEAYRLRMTRHLMTMRNLREDDKYAEICIFKKVTNFLQNSRQGKKTRLPRRIVQHYTPKRVFALAEAEKIKAAVAEEVEETSDHYIKIWNETWTRMWENLSDEARKKWIALCHKFNEVGPDDEYKPEIAERRALSWMRAVCEMFWDQCKVALFMYGLFEDKEGEFRGVVYDVSQMLHKQNPEVPLFRDMKSWDAEFRENFWAFFPGIINPAKSTEKTTELHETLKKKSSKPNIVFERYDDGTPILFNRDAQGNSLSTKTCKAIIREYMSIHHQWAGGKESLRRQPWALFKEQPDKFFAPGMLPEGVLLYDPEHMPAEHLQLFLDHVVRMENPAAHGLDEEPRRFRLSAYRDGTGDHATIQDAVYRNPQPSAVKPAKSPADDNARSYDYGPDVDASDIEDIARRAANARSGRGRSDKRAALTRLEKATQEYTRELGKAKKAVRAAGGNGKRAAKAGGKGKKKKRVEEEAEAEWSKSEASDSDDEGWKELQGDGSSSDDGDGLEDEDLDEDLAAVESTIAGTPSDEDEADAEDDATETRDLHMGFERAPPSRSKSTIGGRRGDREPSPRLSASTSQLQPDPELPPQPTSSRRRAKGKEKAKSSHTPMPTCPGGVANTGDARFQFLHALSEQNAFREMLDRLHPLLIQDVKVTGRDPVKFATWSMSSSHLPRTLHEQSGALGRVVEWLKAGPQRPTSAEVAQRYCLTMGLLLRDLMRVQTIEDPDDLPADLPSFFATSTMDFQLQEELLEVCTSVKHRPPAARPLRARTGAEPGATAASDNSGNPADVLAGNPPAARSKSSKQKDEHAESGSSRTAQPAKDLPTLNEGEPGPSRPTRNSRKRARSETVTAATAAADMATEGIGRRTRSRVPVPTNEQDGRDDAGRVGQPPPAKGGRQTRSSRGGRR
ncbi:hypothetical protein C8Q76DRAFT_802566 [Earliella scabrosa]|nr:hypothetical protein C8Q76DRAFT_802547 [Earliella scabrosa]KAI0701598.1 hypothetical protein C8Q76DRAFT_802566 [Earliella scabrosa]